MTTFEIGLSVFVVAMVASPLVAAIVSRRRRRQRATRRKGLAVGCYYGALVVVGVMALSSAVPVMHLAPCVCGVSAFALLGPFIAGAILLPAAAIPRHPPGCCQECGYDLRASKKRCPECGTPIAPEPR